MTREEIEKELAVMKKKYEDTRNVTDKATFSEEIRRLNIELKKVTEKKLVKDYVPSRDVASIADKKDKGSRTVVRGMITGSDVIVNI